MWRLPASLTLFVALVYPAPATAQLTVIAPTANGDSWAPHTSPDGRYIAFCSKASNLVAGDTNGVADVFVYDTVPSLDPPIRRVSVASNGTQADSSSCRDIAELDTRLSVSVSNRYVAFTSSATNLAGPGVDTNGQPDVFIHDLVTHVTSLVSLGEGDALLTDVGTVPTGSRDPEVSDDGRFVLFRGPALSNIDDEQVGGWFLRDRSFSRTTRIASLPCASGASIRRSDPRYVVVSTTSACGGNVSWLDRDTGLTLATNGLAAVVGWFAFNDLLLYSIDPLLADDTNGSGDLYRWRPEAGTVERVSLSFDGRQLTSGVTDVASPTGQGGGYVAFTTGDSEAVPNDTNSAGLSDVFLRNLTTGVVQRVNVRNDGAEAQVVGGAATRGVAVTSALAVAFDSASSDITGSAFSAVVLKRTADTDNDGLPDEWETQFGLNPFSTAGADGATGDPDNDGVTNALEWARATHPRATVAEYFAEGAQNALFSFQLALFNPSHTDGATVGLRFLKDFTAVPTPPTHYVFVPPLTRRTVTTETMQKVLGGSAAFSTTIESNVSIVADRTMSWDASGYGSHAETSMPATSTAWYLAEGATHSGFQLFYLLSNPGDTDAHVDVTYLLPQPSPPITRSFIVGAGRRYTEWVNQFIPSSDVSATITSTQPLVVERAMYRDAAGAMFGAGHASAGVTTPATEWWLAEGATGSYFDTFVLIANPSMVEAHLLVTYLLPDGQSLERTYTVAPRSRLTIWVDTEDAALSDTAVSVVVTSTNAVPVVVERAMWWPGPTAVTWSEAHDSLGLTTTGRTWAFAEGEQGGSRQIETYLLILNRVSSGTATVTLYFEDGSSTHKTIALPATSRTNVAIGADFPSASGRRFAAVVSADDPSMAIVVERAMYSDANGITWAAGTSASGRKLD
ncbi:MAG: hypothetical protein AB7I50_05935 [Vicinamibacterales bacterium]